MGERINLHFNNHPRNCINCGGIVANSKGTLEVARSEISTACLMTGPDLDELSWEEK